MLASPTNIGQEQCGQIGRFIGLWATLATVKLSQSHIFFGNFCKVVKIYHFSSEIVFGQLLWTFWDLFLVTLVGSSPLKNYTNNTST